MVWTIVVTLFLLWALQLVLSRRQAWQSWAFSTLGLLTFAASAFPQDRTRTQRNEERETTSMGSTHKTESKTESRHGSETTTDEKTIEVQSHDRSNGMVETETTTTTKHKVQSKTMDKSNPDTTSVEKTVKTESKKRADGMTKSKPTTQAPR